MKTKIIKSSIIVSALLFAVNTYAVVSVDATTAVPAGGTRVDASAKLSTRIEKGKEKANQEINRRIEALTKLSDNVNKMVRVSSETKSRLSASITEQINTLSALKAQISADTDINVLKTDIQSITKSYRIFMVIIPQGRITATVDVLNTTADMMTAFSVKLKTQVTNAQNAGKDVTALLALLAEMDAKIADVKVQTTAAINYIINLKPDNGDQAVMKANQDAFTRARADIRVARADLETARQNARKIIKSLKEMKIGVTASSTATVNP